ncbi:YadA-like family protein [Trinickia sp. YCB016]
MSTSTSTGLSSLSTLVSTTRTHYYSVNDNGVEQSNYSNDGATGVNSLAMGTNASASGESSVAVGDTAYAGADGAVALGGQSVAQAANTTAIGFRATANGQSAIALGYQAQASGNQSTAIGSNAVASGANSVAIGANSVASQANSVSVGSSGNERTITNVAPGVNATDAVNVSQLSAVQQNVNNVARIAYSGVAMSMAMSGSYMPSLYPGEMELGVGVGAFQGYSAVAINFKALAGSGRWSWGAGVSTTGNQYGVNAGMGWKW